MNKATTVRCECNQTDQKNNDDKIDLVYTWVNGSDLEFKKLVRIYQQLNQTDQCVDIVKTPFILVIPELIPSTFHKLTSYISKKSSKEWIPVEYKIKNDISSSLFYFEDVNKGQF